MKNTIFSLLGIILFIFSSCNADPKNNREKEIKDIKINIPTFSNNDVQVMAENYAIFVKQYANAIRSKDTNAMNDLKEKSNEMQARLSKLSQSGNMSVDDQKAWADMTQKLMDKEMNQKQ